MESITRGNTIGRIVGGPGELALSCALIWRLALPRVLVRTPACPDPRCRFAFAARREVQGGGWV